jgi:hypothetical protein
MLKFMMRVSCAQLRQTISDYRLGFEVVHKVVGAAALRGDNAAKTYR